jgi:hypothetical protein
MTNANFRRTLVGAAVAAALGVLGTPASAAPYRGSFDPTDFAGEYEINVSAACLLSDGWHANTGICTAQLINAYADVTSDDVTPNFDGPADIRAARGIGPNAAWNLCLRGPDRFVRHGLDSPSSRIGSHGRRLVDPIRVGTRVLWWPMRPDNHFCPRGSTRGLTLRSAIQWRVSLPQTPPGLQLIAQLHRPRRGHRRRHP